MERDHSTAVHVFHLIFTSVCFSQETCDEHVNITMCPLCDRVCDYWQLSTVCSLARASYLFDNGATVLFAIFMSLWGNYTFSRTFLIVHSTIKQMPDASRAECRC